jgi:hypothetical protein
MHLDLDCAAEIGGHKVIPYDRNADIMRGEHNTFDLLLRPSIGFRHDTLFSTYAIHRLDKLLYDTDRWLSYGFTVSFGYARGFEIGPLSCRLGGEVGQRMLAVDTLAGNVWRGHVDLRANAWGQELRLFGSIDAIPFEPPYEISQQVAGPLLDRYYAMGGEAFLHVRKAGLTLGYCYIPGIESSSVRHRWPQGLPPYPMPHSVVAVGPVVGRFLGFSLSGKLLYADTKPFVKAQAALSYEAHLRDNKAHVGVDLVLDYWGLRDPVAFGDPAQWGQWGREIYDLYLKGAIQIHNFRLFYKVDNLLNRRIAYEPGYFMPGLTFRWGFNWLIRG